VVKNNIYKPNGWVVFAVALNDAWRGVRNFVMQYGSVAAESAFRIREKMAGSRVPKKRR
jgi:hypothetical protein